jgi:predicted glutamine amidotransferase
MVDKIIEQIQKTVKDAEFVMLDANQFRMLLHEINQLDQALDKLRHEIDLIKNDSNSWDSLKAGDKVIFHHSISKYITTGKEYLVTDVAKDWNEPDIYRTPYFRIKDDTGKTRAIGKHPHGYRVSKA